jgi:hypothetical protein
LPDYDQPPIPASGDIWTPGYWAWNGYEYFWVPGTWIEPPQPGFLWTPGYWTFVGGVYAFHRGYWGEHVGFYGGVNYGFGYGGVGFEGGHWDNGRFFYNWAVTNIGRVEITNVYNQPVTINETINRVSFNGGPNGLDVKPAAAELEAAKEQHLAPTSDQLHNARVAGRTESAFVSANKGKPRIAATAKPGEFKGAAVIPAKAAGGPLRPAGATPAPTKGASEKTPGEPTPEATKARPENKLERPKAEPTKSEPTPEATKVRPEKTLERPNPEPTKAAPERKLERPKPEPTKTIPPKAAPQGRPTGSKPEARCGHPGEPVCPK